MLIEESLLSLQIRRSSGRSDLRSSPELNPHLLESYWYSVYAALFDIFESDSYISMLAPQFTVSRTFCQETGEVGHHPKPSKRHPRYPQVVRAREDSAQANAHSSLPGESRAPVTIAGWPLLVVVQISRIHLTQHDGYSSSGYKQEATSSSDTVDPTPSARHIATVSSQPNAPKPTIPKIPFIMGTSSAKAVEEIKAAVEAIVARSQQECDDSVEEFHELFGTFRDFETVGDICASQAC